MLLLIDEAQNLAPDTLEQVRLLSNLETDTSKLIQIILIGQPELDAILESPDLRQLRQRISVRWRLSRSRTDGDARLRAPPAAHRRRRAPASLHRARAARDPPALRAASRAS